MPRMLIPLAACVLVGCASATGSASTGRTDPSDSPAELAVPAHAGVDVTGTWATGGGEGEPAAERIVLRVQCNYTPPLWILQQNGDTVRAWAIPASYSQGIATNRAVSTVAAEGRISGVNLTVGTAGAHYVLRYDSTSGHLRGTLNGAPFWAVREQIVRPNDCIPVP